MTDETLGILDIRLFEDCCCFLAYGFGLVQIGYGWNSVNNKSTGSYGWSTKGSKLLGEYEMVNCYQNIGRLCQ